MFYTSSDVRAFNVPTTSRSKNDLIRPRTDKRFTIPYFTVVVYRARTLLVKIYTRVFVCTRRRTTGVDKISTRE